MAGIYFHIPFCKQACYYCDFHFSTNLSVREKMIAALIDELRLRKGYLTGPVDSIYFGGGTPSLLEASEISQLLGEVHHLFDVSNGAELTLEANPDDLSYSKARQLIDAGINRLSIGIQSFDDAILRYLNRAHDHHAAVGSVHACRDAGFENISIDLIYAIPGQLEQQWQRNVNQAIDLKPEHISAYSLTIEEKTVFGRWYAKGKIVPVDEPASAQQMESLIDLLELNGYEQYEVSNFAKPGFYSRHNSSYWKQQPYLGIGPSAHSYNHESRQFNVSNNHLYIKSIEKGATPATTELLTRADKINDYLLTTLRTSWGADLLKLKNDFDYDLMRERERYIEVLVSESLAVIKGALLILTRKGRFLADKISADLFLDAGD